MSSMHNNLILANISNGLAFPHDSVCYFPSTYGHSFKLGYCRLDSMPLQAVVHLMQGGKITIIDATAHPYKPYTDAQKWGVTTWCMVYNRAIRTYTQVCPWQTKEMERLVSGNHHKQLVKTIRKVAKYYAHVAPAVIGINVFLTCYHAFIADDKAEIIKRYVENGNFH